MFTCYGVSKIATKAKSLDEIFQQQQKKEWGKD